MKPSLRLVVCGVAVLTTLSLSAGASTVTLRFQGLTRSYLLHVPSSPNGALVLVFHGGGGTPSEIESQTGFDAISDRERFIVAYPEGIGKSWADGRGTTNADRQGIDDVGFAKAVVDDIARTLRVDRARVYATGPSNGGIFTNTLGCRAADTFAAVAPVIGPIASAVAPACRPSAPMPIVGIQSVADPVVPFDGGEVGGTLEGAAAGGRVQSSRATQALWASLGGCAASAADTRLPVRVQDGTSVTKREYGGCRAGVDVVWYEIAGGGHRWPPNRSPRPMVERAAARLLGTASQNIDASDVIWSFFAAHARLP